MRSCSGLGLIGAGFAACLLLSVVGRAEWSPPILLWQNDPEEVADQGVMADLAVDSTGCVHIAYTDAYRHPADSALPREGMRYTKLDPYGHALVSALLLSDSAHDFSGYPQLRLRGADTVWVMWTGGNLNEMDLYRRYAVLHRDGRLVQPQRPWPRAQAGNFEYWFALDFRRDGAVIHADANWGSDTVCVTVERPNGERVLDDAVVWAQWACDGVTGYVDPFDSLQLFWRNGNPAERRIYAKRVATTSPFDSTRRPDHVRPDYLRGHGPGSAQPLGDSLIALVVGGSDTAGYAISDLLLLRREDYALRRRIRLGYYGGGGWRLVVGRESDSTVSAVVGSGQRSLNYRRFHLFTGELLADTALYAPPVGQGGNYLAYTVGADGSRHVLYTHSRSSFDVQLYYQYWRPSLAVERAGAPPSSDGFTLWPNPSNSRVRLTGPVPSLRRVAVFNLLGQRVWEAVPPPGAAELSLDLGGWPSGNYFVQLTTPQKVWFKRLQLVR